MKSFKSTHKKSSGGNPEYTGDIFLCSYFLSPWQLITNLHNKCTLVYMAADDMHTMKHLATIHTQTQLILL